MSYWLSWVFAVVVFVVIASWLGTRMKMWFPQLTFTQELLLGIALLLLVDIATSYRQAPGRYHLLPGDEPSLVFDSAKGRYCVPYTQEQIEHFKKQKNSAAEFFPLFPLCGE